MLTGSRSLDFVVLILNTIIQIDLPLRVLTFVFQMVPFYIIVHSSSLSCNQVCG